MPRSTISAVALIAVALTSSVFLMTLLAEVARAEIINIVDETFNDGDWSMLLVRENFISSSFSAGQELTGGMPDAFRRSRMFGDMTTNNGGIGPAGALVVHYSTLNSWDPSTQGEIIRTFSAMDFVAFDDRPGGQSVPTGRNVEFGFVLRQDGILYYPINAVQLVAPNSTWHHTSHLSSTANDYARFDAMPGQPDFSTGGSRIEFGYLTSIGTTVPAMNNEMGVDNFRTFVEYVRVPEPAAWLLCLVGMIAVGRVRR